MREIFCVVYTLIGGYKILNFRETIFFAAGTGNILDPGYLNKIPGSNLQFHLSNNRGYIKMNEKCWSNETKNPYSGAHLRPESQKPVMIEGSIQKISAGTGSLPLDLIKISKISEYDILTVNTAGEGDIIFTIDKEHVAPLAYIENKPFVYVIDNEELKKFGWDRKIYLKEFIKMINKNYRKLKSLKV